MDMVTDNVHLMLGDCLERMREIPDGSVDMVLTDPPYGMNFQSGRGKDGPRHAKIKGDDKIDPRFLWRAYELLKDGGALVSFCDWKTSEKWRFCIELAGFEVKSQGIWDRGIHGMGDLKGALAPRHDVFWYATKGRRVFDGTKRPVSVLAHQRPSPTEDCGHPTRKPVGLMRELLSKIGGGGVVLDPFMGSGSTGEACVAEGRKFIGIERDVGYYSIACGRVLS
jgi:site-specific DNA-methyltransferase (adenine-specific)